MLGMTFAKMEELGGIQWPCNEEHPNGTPRLYTDGHFPTDPDYCESWGTEMATGRSRTRRQFQQIAANGRAILYGVEWAPPPEMPDSQHPLMLNTGRVVYHWHTRTKTGRSPNLQLAAPDGYVEIGPADAARFRHCTG